MRVRSAFLLAILLASSAAEAREIRADPITGRIRVLYAGDAVGVPNPFPMLNADPLLDCSAVYACTVHQGPDIIRKSMRVYMPRTYSKFLENDVIVLSDADMEVFRSEHFLWMSKGVVEEGLGLVMIGGAESFAGGGGAYPSWEPTSVADVLPCDMIASPATRPSGRIKILDWEDEFIASLPFNRLESYGFFYKSCNIKPRTAAKLLAVLEQGAFGQGPFLMWWDIGKGRTLGQSADWTPDGGSVFMRWKYYGDYAINMMLFLAGRKLPDDLDSVYIVRRRIRDADFALTTFYNMVDFVEKMGGSSVGLTKLAGEIQEEKQKAADLYVECSMEEALEAYAGVLELCDQAIAEAIKARDAATFWMFVVEWCAVTGTFILCGSVLWLVMVRRQLYREVRLTKLIRSG